VPQLRELIDSVWLQQVNEAAANYFKTTIRTVGCFDPHPSRDEGAAPQAEGAGGGPISSRKR